MAHLGPTTASELGALLALPATDIDKALLRIEATGVILRGKFRPRDVAVAPSASEVADAGDTETEWCERRLLARIHRLTVATLRKQIQPVTAAQFMAWLLRWQHVAPGTQVRGEHGTLEVLRQLQGFEIPANAWERFVLGRRISDYDPAHLDQLCLGGAVGWGRLSPHPATLESSQEIAANGESAPHKIRRVVPTRVAPIAFFVREDADWMVPHHPAGDDSARNFLSPMARQLLELLKQRGALFFPDLVRATGKLKAEIETGLWELVAAGLVTADGFDNLRALVTPKNAMPKSVMGKHAIMAKARRPRHAAGRWSLLFTDSAADRDRSVEASCWMLLRRYGVVFRDLLARETNLPRWRELQIGFRRLEDRGEIRGGRFVSGFQGEQFALPVAVESLREQRRKSVGSGPWPVASSETSVLGSQLSVLSASEPGLAPCTNVALSGGQDQPAVSGERVVLSAADPLNLVGIIVPGERIPAISGRTVTFRDGVWEPEGEALKAAGD
jgi:ATP-dependent Lhr-like helicase